MYEKQQWKTHAWVVLLHLWAFVNMMTTEYIAVLTVEDSDLTFILFLRILEPFRSEWQVPFSIGHISSVLMCEDHQYLLTFVTHFKNVFKIFYNVDILFQNHGKTTGCIQNTRAKNLESLSGLLVNSLMTQKRIKVWLSSIQS